jgi:ParB-like chromosome segregation protein Spo0J
MMNTGRIDAGLDLRRTVGGAVKQAQRPDQGLQNAPAEMLFLEELSLDLAVRVAGVDPEHVKVLSELTLPVPPIVVSRQNLSVIDGVHRVLAARARGEARIAAVLIDSSEAEALVLSVKLNSSHGLPLTRHDRRIAVERIVRSFPMWSDRRIAALAGVSSKTVGAARKRSSEELPQLSLRVGRDGKARPVDSSERRARALELLREKPKASLREIAATAEISLSTASGIRRQLAAGAVPEKPQEQSGTSEGGLQGAAVSKRPAIALLVPARASATSSWTTSDHWQDRVLSSLRADPAMNSSNLGRALLRLLFVNATGISATEQLVGAVPWHRRRDVAELARKIADRWSSIAEKLDVSERKSANDHGR